MYILFFSLSVIFAWQVESLQNNFTYFSYTPPYQIPYFVWLSFLGVLVYTRLFKLAKQVSNQTMWLCHLAIFFFMVGGCLPYQPNTQDIFSTLHILFTVFSIGLVVWIIYRYIQSIVLTNHTLYRKLLFTIEIGLLYLLPVCLINGNINIVVELYCLGFVFYLLSIIEKSQKNIILSKT